MLKGTLFEDLFLKEDTFNSNRNHPLSFVHILLFFKKIRYFLFAGFVLGTLVAIFFSFQTKPKYLTRLNLNIDSQSLPAINDARKVVDVFNLTFSNYKFVKIFFDFLIENSPAFKSGLESSGISLDTLISTQVNSSANIPGRPVFLINPQGSQVIQLEIYFPINGIGPAIGEISVKALNEVARAVNIDTEAGKSKTSIEQQNQANQLAQIQMKQLEGDSLRLNQELLLLEFDLSKLEYSLIKRLKSFLSLDQLAFFLKNTGDMEIYAESSSFSTIGKDKNPSIISSHVEKQKFLTGRCFKILAFLSDEKKISNDEFKVLTEKLFEIQKKHAAANSFYISYQTSFSALQKSLFDFVNFSSRPSDRELSYLPHFQINTDYFISIFTNGYTENKISKKSIVFVTTVIFSFALSVLLGSLYLSLKNLYFHNDKKSSKT